MLRARNRPVAPALALAAAMFACGDGEVVLRADPDRVEYACTTTPSAKDPFGNGTVDRYAIDFEIPDTARSFMVVATSPEASTTIASMRSPRGFTYDFILAAEYQRFHPAGLATVYGVPVDADRFMVPPSPNHGYLLEPGKWEVQADSTGKRFCLSLMMTEQAGTKLSLNVYSVGLDGRSASSLPTDPDWQEVLRRATELWARAGIQIADVRYIDVGRTEGLRYGVITDWRDFGDLVSLSRASSRRVTDALRLNLFLVQGFAGEVGGVGLLGISTGAPGVAGVHGTEDSGIVFAVGGYLGGEDVGDEDLGFVSGNDYLGHVMAHEIGHFLGLFHTTELFGGADPLDDTPGCPEISQLGPIGMSRCNDSDNLMFPIALPVSEGTLSPLQVATVGANPLLRP